MKKKQKSFTNSWRGRWPPGKLLSTESLVVDETFEYLWVYKQAAGLPVRSLQTGQRWTWGAERNLPPWYGTLVLLLLLVVMVLLLLLLWWWWCCCGDGGQDVAPWYPWFVFVKMLLCCFVMKTKAWDLLLSGQHWTHKGRLQGQLRVQVYTNS